MQNTTLTVAEARLLGRNLEKYKTRLATPTAYVDVRAFAQLRVRSITDELHSDALAEHIGGIPWTAAQAMAFHAAHQPHQH